MKATKRRARGPQQSAPAKKTAARPVALPELTQRVWRISAAAILAVGGLLRLYQLGLKPLHHDEGVNGVFLVRLLHEGYYHYDPANYHGPTLYYLALLVVRLGRLFHGDGLSEASLRVIAAIFGIAIVALVLWMHRLLGKREALVAAALIAISPGAVFYSRYFIHETLFVFFTLAIAVCGWQAWHRSDPRYLPIGALAAALLFATKETALVSLVVLALAVVTQRVWARMREGPRAAAHAGRGFWQRLGGWPRASIYVSLGVVLFGAAYVLFYSSFFTNPKGIRDSLATFTIWTKTGFSMEFFPKYAYVTWIWQEEWPLLLVAVVGTAVVVWNRLSSFAAFVGIWAAGLFAAYTLIPYKEPWLAQNFTIPAAIAGGYGAVRLWERTRVLAFVGLGLAIVLLYQTIHLNFVRYDDETEPYVYMQTTREVNDLVREVHAMAKRTGAGAGMAISLVAPEYWPLPWYLRDYRNAGYWGHIVPTQAPVVISSKDQAWELKDRLGPAYQFVRFYDLRPGVTLALFTRK
ncbi:MAG: flippase activity-associated protein Agl23 [Bryobacteraceae bacterium]